MLEERRIRVEEAVPRRRWAGVHYPHIFSLFAEQARHADLGTQCVAIRPDVRGHQETVVGFDQVS
jgi:hypothetical protein